MLEIIIPEQELFNARNNEFAGKVNRTKLQLEHSLISVKKWEEKWHIPFLTEGNKTHEQLLDYIRCMSINKDVDPRVFQCLTPWMIQQVMDYIGDPMTATVFSENNGLIGAQKSRGEFVTAETIYYWMISLNIPVEFQKWHLRSLLTLIRVVDLKNQPEKKMSQREWASMRHKLNEERKAKYHTSG